MEKILVSVVVPVRNGAARLPALLQALAAQTLDERLFEVIVVDDASSDGTAEIASRSGVGLIRCAMRRGDAARNAGIRSARGTVIAFTDDDCVPAEDWLERGLHALDASGAEFLAGHVHVLLSDSPSTAALLDFARHLDQERCVRQHGFGLTANLWVRRELFARVGLFNERLVGGGDREFGLRARATSARLVYAPDVRVSHPSRSRARALAKKAFRVGWAASVHSRHAEGPLKRRPRLFLRPTSWIPGRRIYGVERLEHHGYRPTGTKLISLPLGEYAWVILPIVAGNLLGTIASTARRGATTG
jgi:glycosyltransferase involved in cell wall biosynthesis